ncbi:MAG: RNA-binding domain-containing [Lasallia pustulata]|uniref:RNA-binding domain-containing n=1 Tax=Lasallia pustulata TaxID=136370 RepID=A0A5M8PRH9_9LECA|nr:MAG: RNA-binding domain-containing [Lasallia pustulata]
MSAVDNITDSMASAHINDSSAAANNTTGGEATNASQNEAVIASAAEGRRLYIGNLAYATTEGDLKDFFQDFPVESTSIPTNPRTARPVGYAFVDLSTPAEAHRAIEHLSGKEILERKVSVQLARKPETAAEKAEAAASGGEGVSGGEGGRRRNSGRGRGRGRGRGGRAGRGGRTQVNNDGPTNVPGQVAPLTETTNEALTAEKGAEGTTTIETPKDSKPRPPRQPKQRGPPEDGIPSKNKVMVANLPYDLSEEKLKELFSAYQPSAAKIALRPIPRFMVKKLQARNEPRKGRGFGFVSLASEEMQQKAVNEMNGKEIDGREIAVKVAIDSPGKEDVDPEAAGTAPLTENGVVQANDAPAAAAA